MIPNKTNCTQYRQGQHNIVFKCWCFICCNTVDDKKKNVKVGVKPELQICVGVRPFYGWAGKQIRTDSDVLFLIYTSSTAVGVENNSPPDQWVEQRFFGHRRATP